MNDALAQLKAAAKIPPSLTAAPTAPTPEPSQVEVASPATLAGLPPINFANKEDRFKALKAVEAALNKQFNTQNSVMKLGSKVGVPMPHYSTGIPSFDYGVLSIGGIPRGRIIEIYGPESAGKTTATLEIISAVQQAGGIAGFVDAEHALDPNYAKKLGVNVDELIVSQPDSGEQALETLISLVSSRLIDIGVVDSVAALVPQAELDGEMGDSHMGLQARLMSQAMRKLRGICNQTGIPVIFINQIREKIGVMFGSPETTTGGRALKFYASVRLDVRRLGGDDGKIMSGGVLIGHRMKMKAVKCKVGPPFRETIVDVIYGKGIDRFADLIRFAKEVGAIQTAGAWLRFNGENIGNGVEKSIEVLREKPLLVEEIKKEIGKAIKAQQEADAQ